jgi:7-cyano-7-deazaguanine synthase
MNKAVVLVSGGMDSATLLYSMKEDYSVLPLSVDYGQRHIRELDAAAAICQDAHVPQPVLVSIPGKELLAGSSQTSDDVAVPHGHYAEENMRKTVVPNRNMILLSLAVGFAISRQAQVVAYAAHAGDHSVYPDCRPEFLQSLNVAVSLCDWHPPNLHAPFLDVTKADIVSLGARLGVPFGLTWSCYEGGDRHCGRCGTCVERAWAFATAKLPDPTQYKDLDYWKTVSPA